MDFSENFSSRLKELRLAAGLTQKQLAEELQLTKSVISYYELRERSPSPEIVFKLAEYFHVSADYLMGLSFEKSIDISDLDSEDEKIVRSLVEHLRNKNKCNKSTSKNKM